MSTKTAPQKFVVGPEGEQLTVEALPSRSTTRWVARRKAQVVAAVKGGLLSIDEVCDRYALTIEEYASWQRALERSGLAGLRITKLQSYRAGYSA
jgi:hypothetical protein